MGGFQKYRMVEQVKIYTGSINMTRVSETLDLGGN